MNKNIYEWQQAIITLKTLIARPQGHDVAGLYIALACANSGLVAALEAYINEQHYNSKAA